MLDRREHDFLDHDSYVDCSRIHVFSVKEVEDQVLNDMSRINGFLSANARKRICEIVKGAKTLSLCEKTKILKDLYL